jgi:hypothetical protein
MAFPILIGGGAALILYSVMKDDNDPSGAVDPKASETDPAYAETAVTPGFDFVASGEGKTVLDVETGVSYTEQTNADGSKVLLDGAGEVILRDGEVKAAGRVDPQSTNDCPATGCPGPISEKLLSDRIGDDIYSGLLDLVI